MPVAAALEHLVGLQAQVPRVPHLALWDRLAGYDPAELDGLMTSRAVVRTQLMRTTIHTVTAADALGAAPLLQPVLDRTFAGTAWGQRLRGQDLAAVVAEATGPAGRPADGPGPSCSGNWPNGTRRSTPRRSPSGSATGCRGCSRPPRGLWSASGAAVMTTVEAWLGAGAPASRTTSCCATWARSGRRASGTSRRGAG